MKRQNPPQAHLDNAAQIEGLLRPITITAAYAILTAAYLALVTLTFVFLIHDAILDQTRTTTIALLILGGVPTAAAILFCFLRPRDPVSRWLASVAKQWRTPIELVSEQYTFRELLGDGDGLRIALSLYYPAKDKNQDMKEKIYVYVNSALARDCSLRITVPSFQQIEEAIDPALEIIASEHNVLVLYPVVREVDKIQSDFNFHEGDLESAEFWRTGT